MTNQAIRTNRWCSLLCLALVLSACGATPATPTTAPIELAISPSLVIGGDDSGVRSFSQVRGIVADAAGRVYVADAGERSVRVFEVDGRFVRTIGRPGRGPGEFVEPKGLALVRNELFIYDPRERRLAVFDTGGIFLRQHTIPVTSFGLTWEGGIDSLGRLVDRQVVPVNDSVTNTIYRRLDLISGTIDSGPLPDCGIPSIPRLDFYDLVIDSPFAAGRLVWLDPDAGTWCAHSGTPTAWRIPFGDSTPRDSVVSWLRPAAVTPMSRDSAIEVINRNLLRAGISRRFDASAVASTKPALRALTRDDIGRIWLLAHDAGGDVLHVFSPSRRWIARLRPSLRLAAHNGSLAIGRSEFWAVGLDSLDVPVVLRFPIPAGLDAR